MSLARLGWGKGQRRAKGGRQEAFYTQEQRHPKTLMATRGATQTEDKEQDLCLES